MSESVVEARAVWQWWRYLASEAKKRGSQVVRINIDETSVNLAIGATSRGAVAVDRKRASILGPQVSLSKRRRCLTYISVICDDERLQLRMPQLILSNECTVLVREAESIRTHLSHNVELVRRKSAWCDEQMFIQVLRKIRDGLKRQGRRLQPIVFFDAARHHVSKLVLASAYKLGIWPVTIPPNMTSILQPLDTYVFANFKRELSEAAHRAHVWSEDGVSTVEFAKCLGACIDQEVNKASWSHAFDSNGFGLDRPISPRVLHELGVDSRDAEVASCRPSLDTVALCFPSRYSISAADIFGPLLGSSREDPSVLRRTGPLILGRTRSMTRALMATL